MRMVLLIFESSFRLFVVETLIECIVGIKFRVRATGNDHGMAAKNFHPSSMDGFHQLAAEC